MHQRVVEARFVRRAIGREIGRRHIGQIRDRVHHEEIRAHRSPVHLAQAGDLRLVLDAADVEAQRVAELQSQRLRNAFLDAQSALLLGLPRTADDHVVLGRLGGVGEIELAIDQPLGAVFGVVIRADFLAVHGHQTAANHRIPVELLHARCLQRLLKSFGLLGQHVDHKTIGRIGRRGLLPAADQIGAQQHQQHQRQQAHRQAADLHHRIRRPCGNLPCGQHQPARRCGLVDHSAQRLHREPRHHGEQHDGSRKSADCDAAEFEIAAHRHQQHGKAHHAQTEHQERCRFERAQIAANHAQRRHLRELQNRRQAKREHQREPHAQTEQHRPESGSGQHGIHQPRKHPHEHVVHRKPQRHTEQAGEQADQRELDGVGPRDGALALAQHTQHGRCVEMLVGESARRQSHGHGRKQGREQRDQIQKILRTHQRLVHFGATAVQRLDAHAAHRMLIDQLGRKALELLHRARHLTSHCITVGDAARRLHETRGLKVLHIDQHARRKAHEARTTIRLQRDDAADLQTRIAQQQRVAHANAQRFKQGRIDPCLARCGNVLGDRACLQSLRRSLHIAAQGIGRIHAFERHQFALAALVIGRTRHGRKAQGRRAAQTELLRLLHEHLGRGVVAHHHHIAAEQLQGIALQAALQAVGEKTHRRERGHSQGHRDDQQPQLARTHIAPQGAPAQSPCRNLHVSWPCDQT